MTREQVQHSIGTPAETVREQDGGMSWHYGHSDVAEASSSRLKVTFAGDAVAKVALSRAVDVSLDLQQIVCALHPGMSEREVWEAAGSPTVAERTVGERDAAVLVYGHPSGANLAVTLIDGKVAEIGEPR